MEELRALASDASSKVPNQSSQLARSQTNAYRWSYLRSIRPSATLRARSRPRLDPRCGIVAFEDALAASGAWNEVGEPESEVTVDGSHNSARREGTLASAE